MRMLGPRFVPIDTRSAPPLPKRTDEQLLTPEHRAWRAEVLRRAGYRCQGKDCGRSGVRLFADHIIERADDGAVLDPANGQALCGSCHTLKTDHARGKRMGATLPG